MTHEKYTYFLVGNVLPFFERQVSEDRLDNLKASLKFLVDGGMPSDQMELHARFNSGWLVYNPELGVFE